MPRAFDRPARLWQHYLPNGRLLIRDRHSQRRDPSTMAEAFLVGGVRTPVGRYGGALAGVRPDDLAALVVREAVARAGVDGASIDEVILGAANQAGEDNRNVARMSVL